MAPGDTARRYHRLTSYAAGDDFPPVPAVHPLVMQDLVANDFATWPYPYKRYADDLPTLTLPRAWSEPTVPATATLAGVPGSRQAPDLDALARLLYLSAGVVRVTEREGRPTILFRAAGSAGGRFPLELYLSARGIDGLPDGVHVYDPVAHALRRIGPAAGGDATTLIVTGIPWRTGWRYAERGFRHLYWDGGTMLAQTLALAESAGLQPRLRTRFADAEISRLVGADGVHEFPIALVSFGDAPPAIEPGGDAVAGSVDAAPREFPLVTQAQRAGDRDALGAPWPPAPPLAADPPPSPDLGTVILQRGSARRMDATKTVSKPVFEFSLAAALRGARQPHFIAIHGVEGYAPGLYRWPDLDHPLRVGDLRVELLRVCWDQDLGRDAAYVVIGAADLDRLDDRGYREAQLDAGLVEGRLHLAAYGLGIGASGMTFLDSEIEGLLGEPLAALLFTCVGVPTYRTKGGGQPGQPVAVVAPTPGG